LQDEAYFFCCLSVGLSDEEKENEPWHGRKETAMAFNITTRTRGLQANALLGVIEGFFLVFSSSSSSNFAIIPAPGFLWPDCVCKRSVFGTKRGTKDGVRNCILCAGEDHGIRFLG
jgi:hypothetical protein